jgi:hypothetical protein
LVIGSAGDFLETEQDVLVDAPDGAGVALRWAGAFDGFEPQAPSVVLLLEPGGEGVDIGALVRGANTTQASVSRGPPASILSPHLQCNGGVTVQPKAIMNRFTVNVTSSAALQPQS